MKRVRRFIARNAVSIFVLLVVAVALAAVVGTSIAMKGVDSRWLT